MKYLLYYISVFILLLTPKLFNAQAKKETFPKTKLVVGIVVDQMRNDYIYRYWNRFGNGGFKRLVNGGYYFKNAHFNYIPTYTAPGHSSIYTGATPRSHGIIGNDWFLKTNSQQTYCVLDTTVKNVGNKSKSGNMSPRNLLSSTVGDELKMSGKNSKVYSVALKDRSAILPGGHAADGAFWYDDFTGDFITSSWYMNDLPRWLKNFNDEKYARVYLEKGWATLYPIETYTNSLNDDNRYEGAPHKKEKPVFPYAYKSFIESGNLSILKATPFGNSLTKDIAIECLKKEQLGKDDETDLFCISFSSTDIIGHSYGPRAVETEDVYLRLDKDIEELLNFLDQEVGKNNYTVFLTADHGGADVPNHLSDRKIPAGFIYESSIAKQIKTWFQQNYNDSTLLANISNEQVFISEKKIREHKLDKDAVEKDLSNFLITINGISEAYPSKILKYGDFRSNDYAALLQNGYNHKLSGNVAYIYNPAWMDYAQTGTTHGAGYNYDTHVPVIFYGNGIKTGESFSYISITQLAPTVCELLKINQPNSTIAEPLNNFFK